MLFEEIIQSHYRPSEYPALASLAEEWQDSRPFEGLKILVATPIFRNTLLQYEALLAGGAELYVGRAVENAAIPCDFEIVELLQESEIPVVSPEMVLDMEQEDEFFDLILDCAGQFASCHPKIGFVELTRAGISYYNDSEFPVFNADGGIIKRIETSLGTGNGFFRALVQAGWTEFKGKKLLVFGSGKVGCGIALQVIENGCEVCTITDLNKRNSPTDFIRTLEQNGVPLVSKDDIPSVLQEISQADFVVSATGKKNALSGEEIFQALLQTKALLANMGVEDEFPEDFPDERVLNNKIAINFSLKEPTLLKYLDASLALHAALGERLVLEHNEAFESEYLNNQGPQNPPEDIEQKLLGVTLQNGEISSEISRLLGLS